MHIRPVKKNRLLQSKVFTLTVIILLLAAFQTTPAQNSRNYILLKAGLHFDSQVSGGQYSLPELANIISRNGLDVGIITDHDNMKVSYGIRPFDDFLKFSIKENSIATYGAAKYINEIIALDESYPDAILIPGIEAVPYYHWEGSPMLENLALKDWHTHLLVFGFEKPEIFEKLPSIENHLGYKKPTGKIFKYIAENFMYFALIGLYFLLFILFFMLIIRKKHGMVDIARIRHHRHQYRFSLFALVMAGLFGLILYTQYPFLPLKYTQYDREAGSGPYQALIDYVNANDGLVFWAHPEVTHNEKRQVNIPLMSQTIAISTEAYPQRIMETNNYTGFAIFWEGMKVIGKPGGLWDMALAEYCNGLRSKPVWAMGELDFEESNTLSNVTETVTFLFVKERSRAGVYEAMRAGRMYTTRGFMGNKIVVDEFSVWDMHSGRNAFIGETLTNIKPPVVIHVRIRALTGLDRPETIMLYRGKELIKKFRLNSVIDEWFVDESPIKDKMYYYRIFGGETWPTLASNPIFVSQ